MNNVLQGCIRIVRPVSSKKCEKCGREAHLLEECGQCKRKVCHACEKSSKLSRRRVKGERHVICKTCWGTPSKRTAYKAA
ncbi:MAG: hypothetical protein WCX64_00510 [Candidatus Micrarchaeia archaeon]